MEEDKSEKRFHKNHNLSKKGERDLPKLKEWRISRKRPKDIKIWTPQGVAEREGRLGP
jgi:hypothetical protein